MGKKKTKRAMPRGNRKQPLLQIASLCDNVIVEKDDVISMMRIVDKIIVKAALPDLPPGTIPLTAVISFKAGEARGPRIITLIVQDPHGEEIMRHRMHVEFTESSGRCIVHRFMLPTKETGVYWIDVLLNRECVTRIPCEISYERQRPIQSPTKKEKKKKRN